MALQLGNLYSRVREKCNDEIEIIAGHNGLDNLVRWMHMVEGVEIARFLEDNEVAFTTGIALKESGELLELVKEAYNKKASGIVINIGPYIKEIPQEVISFCNEHSLPLFKMPWKAHMAHVMKFFAEEITLSDKRSLELISAVKNAIYFATSHELYIPALERYGYRMEWAYCAAVCECTDAEGNDIDILTSENIKTAIENAMALIMPSAIVFRMDNQIVMLFDNSDEGRIHDAVCSVIASLSPELLSNIKIYTGIGRNTKSIRCIYKTFNIAAKVAKLQRKRMASGEVASYHKLGISRLFLIMVDEEIMREFYSETLEALVRYDNMNHTDYVDFLRSYFSYGGRVNETAEGMYLHRNSINYKLRKIEEILGCDLSDINVKSQLLIALKLMELL